MGGEGWWKGRDGRTAGGAAVRPEVEKFDASGHDAFGSDHAAAPPAVRPVRWRETKKKSIFSSSCVLERNKEVKKFPVQKI